MAKAKSISNMYHVGVWFSLDSRDWRLKDAYRHIAIVEKSIIEPLTSAIAMWYDDRI